MKEDEINSIDDDDDDNDESKWVRITNDTGLPIIRMSTPIEKISFSIEGKLQAKDFGILFSAVIKLYYFYYFLISTFNRLSTAKEISPLELKALKGGIDETMKITFQRSNDFREIDIIDLEDDSLFVEKISYNSPGIADLLGLGQIIQIVKDAIIYYIPNHKDKLLNLEIVKQNALKDLEIFKARMSILKELGYTQNEIRDMLELDLFPLMSLGYLSKEKKIDLIIPREEIDERLKSSK